MLQAYATNFIKNKQQLSNLSENPENILKSSSPLQEKTPGEEDSGEESISQPELESIMPCVSFNSLRFIYKILFQFIIDFIILF
jgi:hypothetical protein